MATETDSRAEDCDSVGKLEIPIFGILVMTGIEIDDVTEELGAAMFNDSTELLLDTSTGETVEDGAASVAVDDITGIAAVEVLINKDVAVDALSGETGDSELEISSTTIELETAAFDDITDLLL